MSTACSFNSWAPQKHGARQSDGCVNPSFSEHRYPHASPPVIEPAQGSPRAIRGQPSTEFVHTSNPVDNPPGKKAAEMHKALTHENNRAAHAANQPRNEAAKMRDAVPVPWKRVLAREHWWRSVFMSGFARRRVSHIRRSGEHRAFGAPVNRNCTLWTLRVVRLKRFLCFVSLSLWTKK